LHVNAKQPQLVHANPAAARKMAFLAQHTVNVRLWRKNESIEDGFEDDMSDVEN
jgi:hypothetical protein